MIYEKEILQACANDYQVFYRIFAEIDFGGQVFEKQKNKINVKTTADKIIPTVIELVNQGKLTCVKNENELDSRVLIM